MNQGGMEQTVVFIVAQSNDYVYYLVSIGCTNICEKTNCNLLDITYSQTDSSKPKGLFPKHREAMNYLLLINWQKWSQPQVWVSCRIFSLYK